MLSCSCSEWDGDGWYYETPSGFTTFRRRRRKRCISCKELIEKGSDCLEFQIFRGPDDEIEENIHGDEVQIASKYHCEKCGEIFLNLSDIGYCLDITNSMELYMDEYRIIRKENGDSKH